MDPYGSLPSLAGLCGGPPSKGSQPGCGCSALNQTILKPGDWTKMGRSSRHVTPTEIVWTCLNSSRIGSFVHLGTPKEAPGLWLAGDGMISHPSGCSNFCCSGGVSPSNLTETSQRTCQQGTPCLPRLWYDTMYLYLLVSVWDSIHHYGMNICKRPCRWWHGRVTLWFFKCPEP